jgi:hypothetical protein
VISVVAVVSVVPVVAVEIHVAPVVSVGEEGKARWETCGCHLCRLTVIIYFILVHNISVPILYFNKYLSVIYFYFTTRLLQKFYLSISLISCGNQAPT